MPNKTLTIRFYIARRGITDPPFSWGGKPVLRSLLHDRLPSAGQDGVRVTHEHVDHLIEVAGYAASSALHVQIARDLEEVPALRADLHTEPMHLAPGEVPASISHLTFLPAGVVAIVRGQSSAGPHQSASILSQATDVPFTLEPLTREDQLLVLNNASGVSTLEFKATAIDPVVAASDSVMESARRMSGDLDFEVTIKLVARRAGGRRRLRTKARELLENQRDGRLRLEHGRATLLGDGRRSAHVDLLEDQIVETRQVDISVADGQPAATLSAQQVLGAVREAYNDLLVVVGAALSATPSDFPE